MLCDVVLCYVILCCAVSCRIVSRCNLTCLACLLIPHKYRMLLCRPVRLLISLRWTTSCINAWIISLNFKAGLISFWFRTPLCNTAHKSHLPMFCCTLHPSHAHWFANLSWNWKWMQYCALRISCQPTSRKFISAHFCWCSVTSRFLTSTYTRLTPSPPQAHAFSTGTYADNKSGWNSLTVVAPANPSLAKFYQDNLNDTLSHRVVFTQQTHENPPPPHAHASCGSSTSSAWCFQTLSNCTQPAMNFIFFGVFTSPFLYTGLFFFWETSSCLLLCAVGVSAWIVCRRLLRMLVRRSCVLVSRNVCVCSRSLASTAVIILSSWQYKCRFKNKILIKCWLNIFLFFNTKQK